MQNVKHLRDDETDFASDYLRVSEHAATLLKALPEVTQQEISRDLARVWGKITSFLVSATLQSYLSREETFELNLLTNRFQTVLAGGYPLRVEICSKTYMWTVVSIGDPSSSRMYEVVKFD